VFRKPFFDLSWAVYALLVGGLFAVLLLLVCSAHGGTVSEDVVTPFVEVRTSRGLGSGQAIKLGDEILVLTAAHVVESLYGDDPKNPKNKPEQADLFRCDPNGDDVEICKADVIFYSAPNDEGGHDLALLRPVSAKGLAPAHLGLDETLEQGEECWYVGSPDGYTGVLEKSVLAKVRTKMDTIPGEFLVVGGNGWHGNSGGGVYVVRRGQYELVGTITYIDTENPKSCLFCEPQEVIKDFLVAYQKSQPPIMPKADD
jgi:hypothetical protein